MEKQNFYGMNNNASITYLEFGSIDVPAGKKHIWDFRLHDKAYDWLMHARYSNDIYAYLSMQDALLYGSLDKAFNIYNADVYHKDDAVINLSKLLALSTIQQCCQKETLSFFELGQTLFGCIEGMEFYQQLLKALKINYYPVDLHSVKWFGVDISPFFNRLSKVMHQEYTIDTYLELSDMQIETDVYFAKGVTMLYACNSIKRIFEIINKGKFRVFDYSMSLDKEQDVVIGTGKQVKYLPLFEFMEELNRYEDVLYINRANSKYDSETKRVWLDCIYAEESLCKKYIELDMTIRREVIKKLRGNIGSSRFLNESKAPEWMSIGNYIETIKA
ncbi:MAG: hypothetical protein NTX44_11000 [Ignavibacteriales bacterium]|nr:hypothetical protein [Ignavibacteriales bacterium]